MSWIGKSDEHQHQQEEREKKHSKWAAAMRNLHSEDKLTLPVSRIRTVLYEHQSFIAKKSNVEFTHELIQLIFKCHPSSAGLSIDEEAEIVSMLNSIASVSTEALDSYCQSYKSIQLVERLRTLKYPIKIIECLLTGPCNDLSRLLLDSAISNHGPLEVIQLILQKRPECAKLLSDRNCLPLHTALESNQDLSVVRALLEVHPAAIKTLAYEGTVALHWVSHDTIDNTSLSVASYLIEQWPEGWLATNALSETPLVAFMNTCTRNQESELFIDMFKLLAGIGRPWTRQILQIADAYGCVPLHYVRPGHPLQITEYLLQYYQEATQFEGYKGALPIHRACKSLPFGSTDTMHTEMIRLLLRAWPESCNAKDDCGATPVHYAIKQCSLSVIQLFLLSLDNPRQIYEEKFEITIHPYALRLHLSHVEYFCTIAYQQGRTGRWGGVEGRRYFFDIFQSLLDPQYPLHVACSSLFVRLDHIHRLVVDGFRYFELDPVSVSARQRGIGGLLPLHCAIQRRIHTKNDDTARSLQMYPKLVQREEAEQLLIIKYLIEGWPDSIHERAGSPIDVDNDNNITQSCATSDSVVGQDGPTALQLALSGQGIAGRGPSLELVEYLIAQWPHSLGERCLGTTIASILEDEYLPWQQAAFNNEFCSIDVLYCVIRSDPGQLTA